MPTPTSRRTVLAVGLTGVASTAGCLGSLTGSGGPQERSITLAISGSPSEPSVAITPEPSVEGVVTVGVGDDVTFEFANELDADFGVHNHVTDVETVVEAGATATESFAVGEEMVGRHDLEGFVPGDDEEGGHQEGDHGSEVTLAVVEVRPG